MMCLKIELICVLIIIFTFNHVNSAVSDKQYASMPPVFYFDDYDACMMYGDNALYCTIQYEIYPENTTEIWQIIQQVSSIESNYRHDHLRHGICVPKSCPFIIPKGLSPGDPKIRRGLTECYDKKFKEIRLKGIITQLHCETTESPYPIDSLDVITAVFLIVYTIFVLFASFYEGVARYQSKECYERITETSFGRIISAFSLPKNWYRLKHIDHYNPDIQKLRCIQGMRFYSMIAVILSHTIITYTSLPISNVRYTETIMTKFSTVFMASGGFVVQTFFMIGGWLLTYHLFTEFDNKKNIKLSYLFMTFLNRYVRLTPVLAVLIAFESTWMPHIYRGPLWEESVGREYRNCRKYGWANLLYINTYVGKETPCFAHTWYTAIDTQYFIISLILIWFMWNYKNKIPVILGTILLCYICLYFTIIYMNNFEFVIRPLPETLYGLKLVTIPIWYTVMASPIANISGLVAGLGFGYTYYKCKNVKILTTKTRLALWWFLIYGGALGIIIIPGLKVFTLNYKHDILFSALTGSIGRTVFVFSIGWSILGMAEGEGWMMKWVCEWPPTYILGRLTYNAFLVHTVFLRIIAGINRAPVYLTDSFIAHHTLADIAISYIAALILTLFIELPISQLQKMLLLPVQKEKLSYENSQRLLVKEDDKNK